MFSVLEMILALGLFIPMSITALVVLASKESDAHRTKLESFECGFESFSSSRICFSLKFYMVVIMFLIFDVEIVLILPGPLAVTHTPSVVWWLVFWVLMFVLMTGLVLEWGQGVFEWVDY